MGKRRFQPLPKRVAAKDVHCQNKKNDGTGVRCELKGDTDDEPMEDGGLGGSYSLDVRR